MIEFEVSQKGQRTFTWNGKHLCSSFDPIRQGQRWAAKIAAEIEKEQCIFVLGLGNGFHIRELIRLNLGLSVIVVNQVRDFETPFEHLMGLESSLVNVVTINSIKELSSLEVIKKGFSQSYSVVSFPPAFLSDLNLFLDIKNFLCGRVQESAESLAMSRNWKLHPNKRKHLKEKKTSEGLQLIDFGSMIESLETEEADFSDSQILKAVGELVVK